MSGPCRRGRGGVLVDVRLQPGASADRIEGFHVSGDDKTSLKVRVRAQPEKGLANKALIKLLSKTLGPGKDSFEIVSGPTNRNKTVLIRDLDDDAACDMETRIKAIGRTQDR